MRPIVAPQSAWCDIRAALGPASPSVIVGSAKVAQEISRQAFPGDVRKAELVRALEGVPRHPSPAADLEQYRTPPDIAAELLLAAHKEDAIEGKRVLDLGCGTGMFSVGAALLGARLATGVDIDSHAIAMAHETASDLHV